MSSSRVKGDVRAIREEGIRPLVPPMMNRFVTSGGRMIDCHLCTVVDDLIFLDLTVMRMSCRSANQVIRRRAVILP
jgi:hypothetical protein